MSSVASGLAAFRARAVRTGGPGDDGPALFEHLLGWVLVVAVAVLVTRAGLM